MARPTKKTEKKRHGLHHKQSTRYHKVYWPYIPAVLAIVLSFVLVWVQPRASGDVLAYATEMSSGSLLTATNRHRIQNDTPELRLNDRLSAAAQAKANDMAERNYWSHSTPEGVAPWVFIDETDYEYAKAGENLAYGFSSSSKTVAGWMNSNSHRANMLDAAYREVGFGFANALNYRGGGPETVVVAFYAQPQDVGTAGAQTDSVPDSGAITSDRPIYEPATKNVAVIETLTDGQITWAFFAVGLVTGGATVMMLLRHGLKLKKLLRNGEELVLHHPVYDTLLIVIVILGIVLSKSDGFIR